MDNITHSLFGIATAKIVNAKVNKSGDKKVTYFLYFVSIFAANFPDLDILMSLIDPGPLGYLLHHRGHTHTFLYLVPQVLLLFAASVFAFKIKDKKIILSGLGLVSVNMLLHIFLDFQNSYGVHPFSPFNNQWFYNDNLFIIEPLLWFTMLPMLFAPAPTFHKMGEILQNKSTVFKTLRWLFFLVFFTSILYLAFKAQYLSLATMLFVIAIFVTYMALLHSKQESTKAIVALVSAAVVMQVFAVARNVAYEQVYAYHQGQSSQKVFDVILNPMPGNPFCWRFFSIISDEKSTYMIKSGVYQNPFLKLASCPGAAYGNSLELGLKSHKYSNVFVDASYTGRLASLTEDLGSQELNCKRDEWLQFVRAPFQSQKHVYKDLRFDRESNFTEINVTDETLKCVRFKVPWIPPRQDLIDLVKEKQS